MGKNLTYILKDGKRYDRRWLTTTEVHKVVYEKRKFLHVKQWNEILKLPGNARVAEKKAKVHANKVLNFFITTLMNRLIDSDDVFRMPMNLFHMKVVPIGKTYRIAMIPTENGLIHSKFIPWYVGVPPKTTKYIYRNRVLGRRWSEYDLNVDVEKALKRRSVARKRMGSIRKSERNGME